MKARNSGQDLIGQRQRSNRVIIQTNRDLSVMVSRIELDYFPMTIDGIGPVFQRGEMAALDRFFERGFQTFGRAKKI